MSRSMVQYAYSVMLFILQETEPHNYLKGGELMGRDLLNGKEQNKKNNERKKIEKKCIRNTI